MPSSWWDMSPNPGTHSASSMPWATPAARLGIDVLDRLVVRDGRWFAPDCEGDCCPAEGSPLPAPEDTPAVADFVALEMAPVPDRESLAQHLAADVRAGLEVKRALDDGGVDLAGPHEEVAFAETVRRLRWLATWAVVCDVSAARPPLEGLAPEEAAALALSLRDIALRDGIIAWLCPGTLPLDTLDDDLADLLHSSLPEPAWARTPPDRASVVAAGASSRDWRTCAESCPTPRPHPC